MTQGKARLMLGAWLLWTASSSAMLWADDATPPPAAESKPEPNPDAAAESHAQAKLEPTPEAKLNDLVAEYTIRYQFSSVKEAIPVAERALAAAEQLYGPHHERVAQALNDLGHFYQKQQAWDKAQALHERALKIRETVFNGDGAEVIQSLINLGKVHMARKRFGYAQGLFERALQIAERHVQPMDRFLLRILEPYAATLVAQRNTKAAAAVQSHIRAIHAAQPNAKPPSINEVLR